MRPLGFDSRAGAFFLLPSLFTDGEAVKILYFFSPYFSKLHYLANALQRSHSLNEDNKPPSNVITLALLNEQLSATISHQLLGDVAKDLHKPKDKSIFEFIDWTEGEMLAKDVSSPQWFVKMSCSLAYSHSSFPTWKMVKSQKTGKECGI